MDRIKLNVKDYVPYAGLILLVVFFTLVTSGDIFGERNLSTLINEAFMIAISSSVLIFIMSQGFLDLSSGAVVALSAAVGAYAAAVNPWLAIPASVLVGLAVGFANGIAVAKFKVPPFIVTLAMRFLIMGVTTQLLADGGKRVPFKMLNWNSTGLRVVTIVVLLAAGYIVFEYTKLGKMCRAVGANEVMARQSGINVGCIKITGFIIVGAVAGLMGFYSIIRTGAATTQTGLNYEFNAMIALLLGGMPITGGPSSRFRNAVVGGLSMAILSNGMSVWGVNIDIQQAIRGIIFILVIAVTFNRKNIAVIK